MNKRIKVEDISKPSPTLTQLRKEDFKPLPAPFDKPEATPIGQARADIGNLFRHEKAPVRGKTHQKGFGERDAGNAAACARIAHASLIQQKAAYSKAATAN